MRKRRYIIFVSGDEDGALRKIPIPVHYAYTFLAAAGVGLFTIAGLAGSYSRMMMKTARFNQVRSEKESLRRDYLHMEEVAREKDVQAASLGSLASEVTALYGLEQRRHQKAYARGSVLRTGDSTGELSDRQYYQSLNEFLTLRSSALSGQVARRLDFGARFPFDSTGILAGANSPSLWPVQGRVTSSFGERMDPFRGEAAFHDGIDIATDFGEAVHAAAGGMILKAAMGSGYGREVVIDHGHGVETLYAHLSGFAVVAGQEVRRGEVIGFVGSSGRSTGPHLHYEVRIHDTPVNPHKYLRDTTTQYASAYSSVAGGS